MATVLTPDQLTTITLLPPGIDLAKEGQRKPDFATTGLMPDTIRWVTPDESLQLNCRNSLAGVQLQVISRIWNPSGDLIQSDFFITPPSDRSAQIVFQPLYYGYLASVSVYVVGPTFPRRGQTYAALYLNKNPVGGSLIQAPLGAGYLDSQHIVGWPYGRMQAAAEGPGVLTSVLGTAPAAGADWTQTVPSFARWRVRAVRATLTTSAAAGTRQVFLVADDGANTFYAPPSSLGQGPNQTITYDFVPGTTFLTFTGGVQPVVIPQDLVLDAGHRVRSLTGTLQAGDQWTAPRLLIEEVIEN